MPEARMASTFAGFPSQNVGNYLGISPEQAQMLMEITQGRQPTDTEMTQLQQWASGPSGTSPLGPYSNPLDSMEQGLQNLNEHPMGSKYHGDFNVLDTVANVGTGGLYGLGKAGYNIASGNQDLVGGIRSGMNQLGPWGSTTSNIPGYGPQIAETGNLIGAGAGLGGVYGAPFMGGLAGLSAEQMLNQFGGQSTSQGGALGGTVPTTPSGLNPQQLASLSAMNSQAHRGLAPSFEARMQGKSPGAGIAGDAFGQFNQ